MLQALQDMPVIGDWMLHSKAAINASQQEPMFARMFNRTALGKITLLGFVLSTLVFTVNHALRDYPGCVVCAAAYCLLLWATRKKGLGPVVWAHGITNALLWVYTLQTGDWQFL